MMIHFNETHRFQKDWKRLQKHYPSLPRDLQRLRLALCTSAIPSDKHTAIITLHRACRIIKIRIPCRSLRRKTLRVIYAYFEKHQRIEFIELYHKGDQANEDYERIKDYLKALEPHVI